MSIFVMFDRHMSTNVNMVDSSIPYVTATLQPCTDVIIHSIKT